MTKPRRPAVYRGVDWLFGVSIVLIVALMVWRWHLPMFTEMQVLSKRLVARHVTRGDLDQLRDTIERIRSKTEGLEHRLASYEGDILEVREGVYLDLVSRAQVRSGVALEQILPDPRVCGNLDGYDHISVNILTRGTFSEALSFMHELGTSAWSTRIVSLRIQADGKSSVCQMEMEVLFYLRSETPRTQRRTAGLNTPTHTGA